MITLNNAAGTLLKVQLPALISGLWPELLSGYKQGFFQSLRVLTQRSYLVLMQQELPENQLVHVVVRFEG